MERGTWPKALRVLSPLRGEEPEQWGGPKNTQGNLGASVEEGKLSEGRGMAKGFSYFYKCVSSMAVVMEGFLEWWQRHLLRWTASVAFSGFLGYNRSRALGSASHGPAPNPWLEARSSSYIQPYCLKTRAVPTESYGD